ncbi:hypothetical protein ACWDX8_04780 [Streptomyces anthocyanicus]
MHDPQAVPTAMVCNPELDYCEDLADSLDGADLVVLATGGTAAGMPSGLAAAGTWGRTSRPRTRTGGAG